MAQDDNDKYDVDFGGVWEKRSGSYVSSDAPKSKVPDYRHAQKEAMKRGDADTYFMRKVGKAKRGKSKAPQSKKKGRKYSSGK